MKKFLKLSACIMAALCLLPAAACGGQGAQGAQGAQGGTSGGSSESGPSSGGAQGGSPQTVVSPLAVLDEVDVPAAFGDDGTEEWSFALEAESDFNAAYEFSFTSEISGKEKFYTRLGASLTLDDVLGLRSADNALGVAVFGGGSLGIGGSVVAPSSEDEEKTFSANVGFVHDGRNAKIDGSLEESERFAVDELRAFLEESGVFRTFREAVGTIPEDLQTGELRLAVEKLISLGFTADVSTEDGVYVRLTAESGLYTDLLNDLLEEFLPEDWLEYIPRADVRYDAKDFQIALAFDKDGKFVEYSVSSDVSYDISLEVRGLFVCTSTLSYGGTFALRSV